jgi:hypothetical protein
MSATISELQSHVDSAIKEFRRSRPNCAATFVAMSRKLATIPGVTNLTAQQLAQKHFPGSYADYVTRQNRGEKLPVLFPREGYEQRLARAVKNGGRIG